MQFIHIAKGSAGECLSMCAVMREMEFLCPHMDAIARLESQSHSIMRQLGGWAASQRNGPIEGSRYE